MCDQFSINISSKVRDDKISMIIITTKDIISP